MAAMALAAVYPVFVELSAILVVENLLTPLILAAIWAALRARRARAHPYRWILASGALLGLATLTHEDAAVTAFPLAWAAWSALPDRTTATRLAAPAALLATAVLVVVPWTIRNANVLHTFIPVSDETGITLRGTYNPASAHNRAVPYKWRIFFGVPADRAIARKAHTMTEPELNARLTSRALAYIAHNPLAPLRVAYHNSLRLLELEGSFAWRASAYAMGLDRGVAEVGVYSFWALAILALFGAFTAAARRAPPWFWAVPVLLWLSTALVNAETPRFREPVEPFLVILAGCAVDAVAGRLTGRATPYASRRSARAGDAGRPVTAGRNGPAPAQSP
jgi:4-amino-4-deoxy-L-arabinose transferase-like glycosyltransferase